MVSQLMSIKTYHHSLFLRYPEPGVLDWVAPLSWSQQTVGALVAIAVASVLDGALPQ